MGGELTRVWTSSGHLEGEERDQVTFLKVVREECVGCVEPHHWGHLVGQRDLSFKKPEVFIRFLRRLKLLKGTIKSINAATWVKETGNK